MVPADPVPRARLDQLAVTWRVMVDRIDETSTALCAFGTRDGDPVVLKVATVEGDEWRAGRVLSAAIWLVEDGVRVEPGHDWLRLASLLRPLLAYDGRVAP